MQYPVHADFVAPAVTHAAMWRLLAGLLLVVAVYVLGMGAIFLVLAAVSGFGGAEIWISRMATAGTPTSTLLVLATFLGMGLGPMLAARWLHRRGIGTLFGPRAVLWRQFAIAAAICAAVYAASALVPSNIAPQPNLAPALWAGFLPLALVGVLVQTGAEEVLFRGYIQQQLAARFTSPLAWMLLPSALFAVLHYQPDLMGENAWLVVGAVFLFAVLAADLTARTGSLGAAWGFHFANNCVAILVVALDGPLSGLALYTVPMAEMSAAELRPALAMDMAVTLLTWGAIRLAVSRDQSSRRTSS
ncbi:MAG: CPBP family intramembrane metalloprotease [Roseicyclus sp.]|jgi:membrane protease YdiL (CAAX protease family)|nr:CPBP family intramembrane metalloprotease [Roseicyclus sp.]